MLGLDLSHAVAGRFSVSSMRPSRVHPYGTTASVYVQSLSASDPFSAGNDPSGIERSVSSSAVTCGLIVDSDCRPEESKEASNWHVNSS